MKLQNCDRNGCRTLRGNHIRYEHLTREYRCECGKSLSLQPIMDNYLVVGYRVICKECGEIDSVLHYNEVFRQTLEGDEVLDSLPEKFRAMLVSDDEPALDLESITETLF